VCITCFISFKSGPEIETGNSEKKQSSLLIHTHALVCTEKKPGLNKNAGKIGMTYYIICRYDYGTKQERRERGTKKTSRETPKPEHKENQLKLKLVQGQ